MDPAGVQKPHCGHASLERWSSLCLKIQSMSWYRLCYCYLGKKANKCKAQLQNQWWSLPCFGLGISFRQVISSRYHHTLKLDGIIILCWVNTHSRQSFLYCWLYSFVLFPLFFLDDTSSLWNQLSLPSPECLSKVLASQCPGTHRRGKLTYVCHCTLLSYAFHPLGHFQASDVLMKCFLFTVCGCSYDQRQWGWWLWRRIRIWCGRFRDVWSGLLEL